MKFLTYFFFCLIVVHFLYLKYTHIFVANLESFPVSQTKPAAKLRDRVITISFRYRHSTTTSSGTCTVRPPRSPSTVDSLRSFTNFDTFFVEAPLQKNKLQFTRNKYVKYYQKEKPYSLEFNTGRIYPHLQLVIDKKCTC